MSRSETDAHAQATSGHVVVERPPPGLARGKYPLPAWAIGLMGGAVVLAGLVYVVTRIYRRYKR